MKKILIACAAIILVLAGIAGSVAASDDTQETVYTTRNETANQPWDAANIAALRTADKAAIVKLLNDLFHNDVSPVTETDIGDFSWVDLAGDGKYQLLVNIVTRCCCFPSIYWQEAPGKLREQSFDGGCPTLRDLDGDGKQELILSIDSNLPSPDSPWVVELLLVYRLQNGHYVEAIRDFPSFYDREVLPKLEKEISEARQEVAAQQREPKPTPGPHENQRMVDDLWFSPRRHLAVLVMARDTMLRWLGRDPNAGLAEAREWIKSDDPDLVSDAVDVLEEIGGHEQDLRAAKSALFRLDPRKAELQKEIEEGK